MVSRNTRSTKGNWSLTLRVATLEINSSSRELVRLILRSKRDTTDWMRARISRNQTASTSRRRFYKSWMRPSATVKWFSMTNSFGRLSQRPPISTSFCCLSCTASWRAPTASSSSSGKSRSNTLREIAAREGTRSSTTRASSASPRTWSPVLFRTCSNMCRPKRKRIIRKESHQICAKTYSL
jgi:hypothetical protein